VMLDYRQWAVHTRLNYAHLRQSIPGYMASIERTSLKDAASVKVLLDSVQYVCYMVRASPLSRDDRVVAESFNEEFKAGVLRMVLAHCGHSVSGIIMHSSRV